MKRIITILLLLTVNSGTLFSQVKLKGILEDGSTHTPIGLATISLSHVSDSSLLSYTISDKKGRFGFDNLPAGGKLKLIIACVGYKTIVHPFTSGKEKLIDIGTLILTTDTIHLDDVTVIANSAPVIVRNDTIEFNTASFKLKSYAVLEDLLKKLPGMQVDKNGEITMNGKRVNRIYLDGKNFFGSNTQIASKNLSSDIIDKVQVTDDRENDPDYLQNPNNLGKVINVKLKKSIRRSLFGKLYAGYGTDSKYQLGGLLNSLQDTLQISLLGSSNNLNKTGFSFNELRVLGILERGGFENSSSNGSGFSVNDVSFGGSANGIETATGAGININNDWGKTVSLNGQYFYANSNNTVHSIQNILQITPDTTYLSDNESFGKNKQEVNAVSATIKWQPNLNFRIRYNIGYVKSNQSGNQIKDYATYFENGVNVNASKNLTENQLSSTKFQQSFQYYLRSKNTKHSITLNHSLLDSRNPVGANSNSYATTYFPGYYTDSLFLLRNENIRRVNTQNELIYRQRISTILTFYSSAAYTFSKESQLVETKEKDSLKGISTWPVPNQSNSFERQQDKFKLKAGISIKNKKNIRFDFDLAVQQLNIRNSFVYPNTQIDQKYTNLLPSINIQGSKIGVSYNFDITPPGINYLQPNANTLTPYYTFVGNPNLLSAYNHVIGFSYYDSKFKSNWDNYAFFRASYIRDAVVVSKTINSDGSEINTPVNAKDQYGLSGSYGFEKSYRKNKNLKWTIKSGVTAGFTQSLTMVDHKEGNQYVYKLGIDPAINLFVKDWLEVSEKFSVYSNIYHYAVSYTDNNFTTSTINSNVSIKIGARTVADIEHNYAYNSNIPSGLQNSVHQVNIGLSYQPFTKNKSQIKLSVYDLLNQNVSLYNTITPTYVSVTQTDIIKRYLLLSFVWNFKSIKSAQPPKVESK